MMRTKLISLLACALIAITATSCEDDDYPDITVTYPYVDLYVDGEKTDSISIDNRVNASKVIDVASNQDYADMTLLYYYDEDDTQWLDFKLNEKSIDVTVLSTHTDIKEDRQMLLYVILGRDYSVTKSKIIINQSAAIQTTEE